MSKKAHETALPKLRFPEFRNKEAWEINTLGSVAAVAKGVQVNKVDLSADMKYPVMNGGISPSGYLNTFNRQAETICISEGGNSCGFVNLMQTPFWSGGHNYTLDKLNRTSTDFLYQFLKFKEKEIMALRVGSGLPNIQIGALRSFDVFHPSLPEQQKVAAALSSLDALLTAQTAKLTALQAHKRGLMQDLFPAEGETVPKRRFPEFRDAGEWAYKDVSTFAKVTTGNKDTQNKVGNGLYPFFVRSQSVERINSFSYDGEAILTSGDGVGVGKNFHYINGKFDFHQRVYSIYNFAKDVSGKFFYLYFSQHFGARVKKLSAKNSVDSVRMSMITDMKIHLPTLQEQQRIADCFSSLDNLITAQSQKIDALKLHKEGLMQALFPQSNAVN